MVATVAIAIRHQIFTISALMLFLAKCLVKITSKTFFALALTSGFGAAICVAGVHTSFALGKSASAGHNVMAAPSCLGAAAACVSFFAAGHRKFD